MKYECGEVDRTSLSHLVFNLRRSVLTKARIPFCSYQPSHPPALRARTVHNT